MKSKTSKRNREEQVSVHPVKEGRAMKRYSAMLTVLLEGQCRSFAWFPEVAQMVRASDWAGLYSWSELATTEVYSDAVQHYAAAQISALIKKFPLDWRTLGFSQGPSDTAIESFLAAERRCK